MCISLTLPLCNCLQGKEPRPETYLQRLIYNCNLPAHICCYYYFYYLFLYIRAHALHKYMITKRLLTRVSHDLHKTRAYKYTATQLQYRAPPYEECRRLLTRFIQGACLQAHGLHNYTVTGRPQLLRESRHMLTRVSAHTVYTITRV